MHQTSNGAGRMHAGFPRHKPTTFQAATLDRFANDGRDASGRSSRNHELTDGEEKMVAAPGKTCGSCTMCCSALEIAELAKPAGPLCSNCRLSKGCAIYADRPGVCRDFE